MIARRTNAFPPMPSVVPIQAVDGFKIISPRVRDYILIREVKAPSARPPGRITIADIQVAVCVRFELPLSEMRSDRRAKAVAQPRQLAMFLAKQMTSLSLPQIGRQFGGRDHSTVLHAIAVTTRRIADEPEWFDHHSAVRATLENLLGEDEHNEARAA